MEYAVVLIIGAAVGLIAGWLIGTYLQKKEQATRKLNAQDEADNLLAAARAQSEKIKAEADKQAREEIERRTHQTEKDLGRKRSEIEKTERKLSQRELVLDRKIEAVAENEKEAAAVVRQRAAALETRLKEEHEELQQLRARARRHCEEISGLTEEQARRLLLEMMETEVRSDAAAMVRRVEAETREMANKRARQIVTLAIQKCATDQVSETTVSVVNLPNDDMKGRIIGKEGRNIRALEATTGCNIIVDDTPEAVVLSCFDPLRREIARLSLEKLLGDGRIHPGRIEEVVAKVERELADQIREIGEQTIIDLGIANMHPELIKTLGRLKYRTSYGQNMLIHSGEVARLCGYMAAELGADVESAKRAGLLHDIGKALSYEMEGTHALIGAELAKKCNESPGVVHAIAAHHNEEEPRTIIAVLVQAADAVSSARPGVRRESLENYVKRMQKLEAIAEEFRGVTKAYAIQAGRELRIMVEPTEVNDNEAAMLARDVTKKVEQELEYPGQIKVTVCREMRVVEYAK